MFTASQLLDKINNHLSENQITRTPEGLYEPIEYILSLGGKRIRPVLMLMAYNLYKEDVSSIYDPAIAAYFTPFSILRALGDSKTPLIFLVFCSLLNIVLDLLFVVVLKTGVAGAAFAYDS